MGQGGGDLVVLTPAGYHRLALKVHSTEADLWEHSLPLLEVSSQAWEGERWAGPDVVPSLVQELALSLLRSLLGADSPDSSASEAEVLEALAFSERRLEDEEERP